MGFGDKVGEINEFLTAEKLGLPFPVLIERLSHFSYPEFGIRLSTQDDLARMQEMSRLGYAEWVTSDWRMHALIVDAIKLSEFRGAMADMNVEVGFLVSGLLRARSFRGGATRGTINFFDAGTGEGETLRQVIWQLVQGWSEKLLAKCRFTINDIAEGQLMETARNLRKDFHVDVDVAQGYAEDVLGDYEKRFDFIIANASFHHISLNTIYPAVFRALKDNGAAVVGDYYTGIGDDPVRLVRSLEALGANKKAVRDLRYLFKMGRHDHERLYDSLPPTELAALNQTITYIAGLVKLIRERKITEEVNPPLEAMRTVANMTKEAHDAGFLVGIPQAKQVFPKFAGRSPRSPFAEYGRFGSKHSEVAHVTVLVKDPKRLLKIR